MDGGVARIDMAAIGKSNPIGLHSFAALLMDVSEEAKAGPDPKDGLAKHLAANPAVGAAVLDAIGGEWAILSGELVLQLKLAFHSEGHAMGVLSGKSAGVERSPYL